MSAKIVYIDASEAMSSLVATVEGGDAIKVYAIDPAPGELPKRIASAHVVINGHSNMTAADIAAAPDLKSIVFLGTGASSYIDVAAAAERGVRVRTIRGYGDRTIAEHAFALLLAAARDVAVMDREVRSGVWAAHRGIELAGRTLGLVGTGGVGREMARMGKGFGMNVLAWNRSGVPADLGIEMADLDTVLERSDAVSIHLALVPETRGLIDARRIARMKRGVLLINTARGAIIDETALIEALQGGHIRHAALDVFETEPLPARHPLTRLPNVTLTSHAAWNSAAASERLMLRGLELAFADAAAIARGETLAD